MINNDCRVITLDLKTNDCSIGGKRLQSKIPKRDLAKDGNSVDSRPTFDNLWMTKRQLAVALGMSVGFINKWMKRGL